MVILLQTSSYHAVKYCLSQILRIMYRYGDEQNTAADEFERLVRRILGICQKNLSRPIELN
jgi:hypothetical protein